MPDQRDLLLRERQPQPQPPERVPIRPQLQATPVAAPGETRAVLAAESTAVPGRGGESLRNGQMLRLQRQGGNQLVQRLVQTRHGDAASAQPQAEGDSSWREMGNLRGNPPVRSENPPNKNVVEDEAVYTLRRDAARAALQRQRERTAKLVDQGNVTDFRYFFARVYSFVTENELKFAESRAYYYPSYVMASVLYFEQIYHDNFEAFSSGARVEQHWRAAFEQMARNYQMVEVLRQQMLRPGPGGDPGGVATAYLSSLVMGSLRSLVAGMQAHIRADLPRAEAWVFNSYYRHMPGVTLDDFRTDFMSMSGVFDNAGREMNAHLSELLSLPLDRVPQLIQDTSMRHFFDADMSTERADTWRRAQELSAAGLAGTDPYQIQPGGLRGNVTDADHMSGLQQLPSEALRPSMSASVVAPSDTSIRAMLAGVSPTELARAPALQRVQWVRRLFTGATFNADEDAILKILSASRAAGDLVNVVDGADAWDMMYSLDQAQATTLRTMLRADYYAATAVQTALRLIQKCLEGETAEWEEQMVIDLLEARQSTDAHALIQQLGQIYGGPTAGAEASYRSGLATLEAQLDGEDRDRLHRIFGRSNGG